MHELGLTKELVDIVDDRARKAGASRIKSVSLVIGAFSGVEADAVSFCFEVVAKGTLAEGAALVIEKVPLRVDCASCGRNSVNEDNFPICPLCGGTNVVITAGREFVIRSMEVEDNVR